MEYLYVEAIQDLAPKTSLAVVAPAASASFVNAPGRCPPNGRNAAPDRPQRTPMLLPSSIAAISADDARDVAGFGSSCSTRFDKKKLLREKRA